MSQRVGAKRRPMTGSAKSGTPRDCTPRVRFAHPGYTLFIQLLEVAVDAPLAERDTPRRGKIGGDARALGDAVTQRENPRHLPFEALHALGKRVAQTFDDLEQREVDIAEPAAEQVRAARRGQNALEIAQIFRNAVAPEVGAAALGGRALLLVIKVRRHGMVR